MSESAPLRPKSLWHGTCELERHAPLEGDLTTDVAIVGGGIVGLMAAALLQREGLDVTVIERRRVGAGTTGGTTAKVTSLHSLTYDSLESTFGEEGTQAYAQANEAGIALIAELAEQHLIDCGFRRRTNYTWAESPQERQQVESEVEAAKRAGLAARFVDDVGLPFDTHGAIALDDQAEFHPLDFIDGLARVVAAGEGRIFEETQALRIEDGNPCRVQTDRGVVTAGHVIVATNMPFTDRGLYFAREHPERSYSIAVRVSDPLPVGMFINISPPTRSIRTHPVDGEELLLLGGEGHKVGQKHPTGWRYRYLEEFAEKHWGVRETLYRWSAQDQMTVDRMPLVGRLTPRSRASYTATGFKKWGIAMAAGAAIMLTDAIAGRENPWAGPFDSTRLHASAKGAKDLVKENANVGAHFFGDRLTRRARASEELRPGEGKVVSDGGRQVAVARDEDGELHAVSARCTHLFCIVNWNDAERSWDCPCHGSRFAPDGAVIEGPATSPLPAREPPA